ncbi:hypothetical protein C6P40_003203 [Pichia californica]|uniref:Thioesterase domain-containing protein n=1 Tax=Pichia californica TaxID=460514 RepID=A0A9P6WGV0_9ASCO|nr:hypothetical protein C6P42_003023 [[Candida] californica]KAG0686890.1 hypothetical protein C6P40_003203 [[Candida] californica]
MNFNSVDELTTILIKNKYEKISELLNNTNENLFVGPNNLLNQDKIQSAKIFTKLIYTTEKLNYICYNNKDSSHKCLNLSNFKIIKDEDENNNPLIKIPISNHLVGIFKLGRNLTSHIHIIHGGAIATLIDEYFVKVVLPLTPNNFAVTANLNIKYLKPVKFLENQDTIDVILNCFITDSKDGRKFTVKGSLLDLDGNNYCIGEVLVVVPKEL